MNNKLTNDADLLFDILYNSYRNKIKNGISKVNAKTVDSAETIQSQYLQNWTISDIHETIRELDRAGYLCVTYADNIPYFVDLNDEGIIYMENRVKNFLKKGVDILSKFR